MPRSEPHPFTTYRLPDVLVWVSVFFLWREYYRVVDPPQMVWIFASITTVFAAFTFYFTYYFLVPRFLHDRNLASFLVSILITLFVLAPIRSGLIYLSFHNVMPDKPQYFGFFRSITASGFHISYIITFATLIRFFIDRYEAQKKLDVIIKENLRTELNYLKAQINPHFLFNIFNSIYFLIEENPRMASAALLKLSGIMRYQLYDCGHETVSLEKEIENIESYVELETMRIAETVHVHFDKTIDHPDRMIAPFILLTFVENAFKHVSRDSRKDNRIDIRIREHDSLIEVRIENTTSPSADENANGIGLANVRRRLELLYPGKHDLNIDRRDDLFISLLKMEL